MTPRDLIAAARLRLLARHPYLAATVMGLRPVAAPGIGAAGTPVGVDAGLRLYYDPAAISGWTVDGLAAVLLHEEGHVRGDHSGRRAGRDPREWNIACDRAINPTVRDAGWTLPAPGVWPAEIGQPSGLTAEAYYDAATPKPAPEPTPEPAPGQPGDGEPEPGAGEPGAGEQPAPSDTPAPGAGGREPSGEAAGPGAGTPSPTPTPGAGQPSDSTPPPGTRGPGPGSGQCGSVAGGDDPEGWEAAARAAGSPIPEPASSTEQAILRRTVAQEIAHSSQRGTMPAAWREWAEAELRPPTLPWQAILARRVRAALASASGCSDYSYSRPSRRQAGLGPRAPIMPCLRRPRVTVAGVLDVSGSMTGGAGDAARAEIDGIVRACGEPLTWVACDAAVQATVRVAERRDVRRLGDAGGGTDLTVGIAAALRERPQVIVLLTDGETPYPPQDAVRGVRIVAAITPGGPDAPAWIDTVRITQSEARR